MVWSRWLTVIPFSCHCSFSHLGHWEVGFLHSLVELLQSRMPASVSQPKQEIYEFCGDFHVSIFFPYYLHKLPPEDRKPWICSIILPEYQRQGIRTHYLLFPHWRRSHHVVNGHEVPRPGLQDFPRASWQTGRQKSLLGQTNKSSPEANKPKLLIGVRLASYVGLQCPKVTLT